MNNINENLVSVVIPMYNSEKFIVGTIQSIEAQTYRNIELIIVDDGSSDASYDVAVHLLQKGSLKYKIIKQDNLGVSAARNTGIRFSSGVWIIAIDSDDSLEMNAIEEMINHSSGVDVVFSGYKIVKDNSNFSFVDGVESEVLNGKMAIHKYYWREADFIAPASLARKEFLLREGIEYDEDCRFAEDDLFVWKLLSKAVRIGHIKNQFYRYNYHSNSTMTSSKWDKFLTTAKAARLVEEVFINNSQNTIEIANSFLLRHYVGCLHAASLILSRRDYFKLYNGLMFRRSYIEHMRNGIIRPKLLISSMYLIPSVMFYLFRVKNWWFKTV